MAYQPVVPLSGIAGWRFLQRTQEKQAAAFGSSADVTRDIAYFKENIASIRTSADLVADRRLLKVALGAFGLEAEIDKKALIRKVLDEGTEAQGALATRMSEKGFAEFSKAFGFGNKSGPQTAVMGFASATAAAYETRAFESAVGDSDESMGLALQFKREMPKLAANGAGWFSVLGSKALREVMDKALGLPASFAQIDIDKQAEIYEERASRIFGGATVKEAFSDPEAVEKAITRFLARAQIEAGTGDSTSPAAMALTLLQNSSSSGSSGMMNLLSSLGR